MKVFFFNVCNKKCIVGEIVNMTTSFIRSGKGGVLNISTFIHYVQ